MDELYDMSPKPLIKLQNKLLNVIGVNVHDQDRPLSIKQVFVLKSVI